MTKMVEDKTLQKRGRFIVQINCHYEENQMRVLNEIIIREKMLMKKNKWN